MEHLSLTTPPNQLNPVARFKFPLLSHLTTLNFHVAINGTFNLNSMNSIRNPSFNFTSHPNDIYHRQRSSSQNPVIKNPKFAIKSSAKNSDEPSTSGDNTKVVIVSSVITLALAVANRVLYKLALIPMREYPFFLAQLNTFGYVAIYFSFLYLRYKAGTVTDEMLGLPKYRFMMIGCFEALGIVCGMSSGAVLPGPAIPILNQTFLVWQLAFSFLLLGRRYSLGKIMGCLLVAAGVVLAVMSGSDNGQMLGGIGLLWPSLMILSSAFQAGASIIKESVFLDAASRLKGRSLDIFVVNSFGSLFQGLFVLLFLPFLSSLKGIPISQLPAYLKSGAGCFLNLGFNKAGCDGAPLLPLLYITCNICFNISLLRLVKISSAVVASLAAMSSVPISIYALSLPLPYLPGGVALSPFFHLGGLVLAIGLLLYNLPLKLNKKAEV